jgi:hypothetical protein
MTKKIWRDTSHISRETKTPAPTAQTIGGRRVHTPTSPRGYKSDLDKMFDTGEVPDRFKDVVSGLNTASGQSAERQRLIRAARTAESHEDFEAAIRALVATYTLPDDEPLLIRMLDLSDEELLGLALDQLIEMDATRGLQKRSLIRPRLDTIAQLARTSHTRDLVDMLRERM